MLTEHSSTQAPRDFEADAVSTLTALQTQFSQVLEALPGRARRPVEISRSLGIHQTLAWKLARIVDSADPITIAPHIPGTSGVNIFLSAAEQRGVPSQVLSDVKHGVDAFHRLIDEHAGDRKSLELMLARLGTPEEDVTEINIRKEAFRATSFTWGVQAGTRIALTALGPGSNPDSLDLVSARCIRGFRRLRPETPWIMARSQAWVNPNQGQKCDPGTQPGEVSREPLDPQGFRDTGIPLLRAFSTPSIPGLSARHAGRELLEYLAPGPIGNKAAIDYATGEIHRSAWTPFASPDDRNIRMGVQIRLPVESMVYDTVIKRGFINEPRPEISMVGEAGTEWYRQGEHDRESLPFSETMQRVGQGLRAFRIPEFPKYHELARLVFERAAWDPDDFDVFRVRVEYPMLRTALIMRCTLSEQAIR